MKIVLKMLFRLLVGFIVFIAIVSIILFALILVSHRPDKERIESFKSMQAEFDEINSVLRDFASEQEKDSLYFFVDFNARTLTYIDFNDDSATPDKQIVYTGEAVDKIHDFENRYIIHGVYVSKNKTEFSYGEGSLVYTENGRNPASFSDRYFSFVSYSYKLTDNWFYTKFCDLRD